MPITLLTDIKLLGESPFNDKDIVGAYVFPCKDLKANQPLFNDGFPSILFMPRLTDEVHLSREGQSVTLKPVWVCCGVIKDTQWNIPDGLEYILVLRFKPSSFYSIFKVKPSMFVSDPIRNFEDLVDERWVRVIREMYSKDDFPEKVAVMKDALARCEESGYLPYMLQIAIEHIDQKKGNTTVSNLLHVIGGKVNQKWLQRSFIKYIGMPPKKYISLQRFIYTYGQCDSVEPSAFLGAAMLSGYYDYNHFLKDFKQYMGIAPSQYSWD